MLSVGMVVSPPRLSQDEHGTPGIWAKDATQAFMGVGMVHGRFRPLQTLILHTAASGTLAKGVWGTCALEHIDTLVRRFNIEGQAKQAIKQLDQQTLEYLLAYAKGFAHALEQWGEPGTARMMGLRLVKPTPHSILAALLLSAYVGQAEGQERMERALLLCVQDGAHPEVMAELFCGLTTPDALRQLTESGLPRLCSAPLMSAVTASGGSNAWAVDGAHAQNGAPLLAGDPHLPIGELPSALCPIRAHVGDNFWLGATIPGLPALFVGRNAYVAFAGTFAFADTLDLVIHEPKTTTNARPNPMTHDVHYEEFVVERRFKKSRLLRMARGPTGPCDDASKDKTISTHWSGGSGLARGMAAYMQLALAKDVEGFNRWLNDAKVLSLTFVAVDRFGATLKRQTGAELLRPSSQSGLFPYPARLLHVQDQAQASEPVDPFGAQFNASYIVSANEGCLPDDVVGRRGHTLTQPDYRKRRITQLLRAEKNHSVKTFQAIQQDIVSLQAKRLAPLFAMHLPAGFVRDALTHWSFSYAASLGAPVLFEALYMAAKAALSPWMGAGVWPSLLQKTELNLWWCRALDHFLFRALSHSPCLNASWHQAVRQRIIDALKICANTLCRTQLWGQQHTLHLKHPLFGTWFGAGRGPYPWDGSLATVNQASMVSLNQNTLRIGPAFRFVADMSTTSLLCALPGGVDERPWSVHYASHLEAWRMGIYHVQDKPQRNELS